MMTPHGENGQLRRWRCSCGCVWIQSFSFRTMRWERWKDVCVPWGDEPCQYCRSALPKRTPEPERSDIGLPVPGA